ncbi:hypothetical protein PTKIN_Ptkin09bG0110300 [Pterospermum kingtungense]
MRMKELKEVDFIGYLMKVKPYSRTSVFLTFFPVWDGPKLDQEDIVDVLLQIRKDRQFTIELTMDHIKAVLMNVFIAGTDTNATSMVSIMSYLLKNPRCLKKTQKEVRNLIVKKGFVNEDDVQALTYLDAVIKKHSDCNQ